jgi:hypothetical protein
MVGCLREKFEGTGGTLGRFQVLVIYHSMQKY